MVTIQREEAEDVLLSPYFEALTLDGVGGKTHFAFKESFAASPLTD